jgi:hypothetical protein
MQYIIHIYSVMIKEKGRGGDVLLYISPPFYQGLVVTVVLSLLSLLPLYYPMVLFGAVIVMLPPR